MVSLSLLIGLASIVSVFLLLSQKWNFFSHQMDFVSHCPIAASIPKKRNDLKNKEKIVSGLLSMGFA